MRRPRQFWIRDEVWFKKPETYRGMMKLNRNIWMESISSVNNYPIQSTEVEAYTITGHGWYPYQEPFSTMRLLKVKRRL